MSTAAPGPRAVTTRSFAEDVLQRSRQALVVVDFWAPWCQPCHMLDPILERIATELSPDVEVARINVDEEPGLAQQLQVRSLPTVVLVQDGRVVDGFAGVRPEEEIRALLARHLQQAGQTPPQEEGPDARLARLEAAHAENPDNPDVGLELAEALAANGEIERAESLLQGLPVNQQTDRRAERTRALIHFHRAARDAPEPAALEARLASHPQDLDARHQLAAKLVLRGDFEPAAEQWLEIMRRDRRYGDELGRRALLDLFALLGPADELAQRYRRRLTSLLM